MKELRADDDLELDPCLDRDTSGVPGAPDIAATIFDKIKAADIFVGDVSFINQGAVGRTTPNPNVLVELGYAAGWLGWDKIICVFNKATGSINDLPFDIRPRRVRAYALEEGDEKADQRKALVGVLKSDVTDILHAPDKEEAEALQHLLSRLAFELIDILILCDEIEQRSINPWFDSLRSQFGATAHSLRHMAVSDTAIRHSMATELEEIASSLDEAANLQLHRGSWPVFQALLKTVAEKTVLLKQTRIDCVQLADDSISEVKRTLNTVQRTLAGLASRAEDMAKRGRLDDLRSEASRLGQRLLRVSYYNIDAIRTGLASKVRKVGRDLHVIEMMRVYGVGGQLVQAIVHQIERNSAELAELVRTLEST